MKYRDIYWKGDQFEGHWGYQNRDMEWKGCQIEGHKIGSGKWNLETWIKRDIMDFKYRHMEWQWCQFEGHQWHKMQGYGMKGISLWGTSNWLRHMKYMDRDWKGGQFEGHQGHQIHGHGMKGTLIWGTSGTWNAGAWNKWDANLSDMQLFKGHEI